MSDTTRGLGEVREEGTSAPDSARRDLTSAHSDTLDTRDRHRFLLESMNEPIGGLDLDGRFVFCNAALVSALGYESEASLSGRYAHDVMHGARGDAAPCGDRGCAVARAFGERTALVVDDALLSRADGTAFYADLRTSAIRQEGRTSGSVFAFHDLTERRRRDLLARELDLAVRQSTNIILTTDTKGDIRFVNPAFTSVYGYSEAEAIGRNPRFLQSRQHDPDFFPVYWKAMQSASGFRGNVVNRTKDGRLVTVDVSANCLRSAAGEVIGYVAVQNDVTDRAHADAALAAAHQRVEALMENATDAIFVTSTRGVIVQVNRAAERLTGRLRAELSGLSVADLVPPEERFATTAAFAETVIAGALTGFEGTTVRADGERILVEVSAALVHVGGEPIIHAIVRDVSERKRMDDEFRRAQKLEAVGLLAGGIAHDFNNLLMVVQSVADILPLHGDDPEARARDLENLRAAAQSGGSLTRQLLSFSRPQGFRAEDLDPGGIVSDLAPMVGRLIGSSIALSVVVVPGAGLIHIDRGQLEQVIMNLVVNARDAMPDGGRLSIVVHGGQAPSLTSYAPDDSAPDGHVVIEVADTGSGMSREVRERIFDPFFTTKDVGHGTGLGLATVYGIVHGAKGEIRVSSTEGEGSTFFLYFPAAEGGAEAPLAPASTLADPGGHETVFLVEDDGAVRHLIETFLSAKGYRVVTAKDGSEAIERLSASSTPIHVLVTAVVLPGRSGREVARVARDRDAGTRVIFVSAYSTDTGIVQKIASEGEALLQKPFRLEALAGMIRRELDRSP